jgi:phage baseplate assembly protein W
MAISFKSVGQTPQQVQEVSKQSSALPIGIKTPLELDTTNGLLKMHYSLVDQISDNFRNLLLTNWGERVGEYFFGANLRPITAEFVSLDNFDGEAVVRIKDAVSRWMPYIDLIDFSSEMDRNENPKGTAVVSVTISYNIPSLKIYDLKTNVSLYVM